MAGELADYLPERSLKERQKGKHREDSLAQRFRLSLRELMTKPDIIQLIEDRVRDELEGNAKVEISPTVMKIAAGQYQLKDHQKEQGWVPPGIHIHMMDPQQLENFVKLGIHPGQSAPKTIEARKVENPTVPPVTYES